MEFEYVDDHPICVSSKIDINNINLKYKIMHFFNSLHFCDSINKTKLITNKNNKVVYENTPQPN